MSVRRPFWLAFAGFLLLATAWAVSLPANGTYDESQHIARAYAVYSGQWLVAPDRQLEVPASLLPANPNCTWAPRPVWRPASCQRWLDSRDLVAAPSDASRYPPLYYLLVGAPIRLRPDRAGIIFARVLSAVVSALLLASAVALAVALRAPMLAAAVVLAATPTVINLVGSVNPNGMEVAAAILLFTALLALFDRREDGPGQLAATRPTRRTVLALTGIAAFLLLTLRTLGPVLAALDFVAVALVVGWARVRAELRRRDTQRVLGASVVGGTAVAVVWLLMAGSPAANVPTGSLPRLSTGQIADAIVTSRIPFYVEQVVARFSYGETRISPWAILLWYLLAAAASAGAVRWGGRRLCAVLVGMVAASLALLVGLELAFLRDRRWYAQGRYVLPVLVGVVLVAAWTGGRGNGWRIPVGLIALTAPVHVYALVRVLIRFETGTGGALTTLGHGPWHSPAGTLVPLTCVLVGVALLVSAVPRRRVTG